MPAFATKIITDDFQVDERLFDFGLVKGQFIAIADVARRWALDAGPLMPLNAPGTLAYIYGVNELRDQLLDEAWQVDRVCGVEAVINRRLGLRIGFQNVDRACDPDFAPLPRSAKGAAAELLNGPTLFEHYGIEAGPLTGVAEDGVPTYYAMVGEDGSVELSQPIIAGGMYKAFVERIFIRGTAPDWGARIDDETGPIMDFEIPVRLRA
ncbi:MAG: hypothetical protein H6918_10830 [Sphingomonadaceae bacterium]|nr:hypothetical protein [Sphingomonadaceae bacterium]